MFTTFTFASLTRALHRPKAAASSAADPENPFCLLAALQQALATTAAAAAAPSDEHQRDQGKLALTFALRHRRAAGASNRETIRLANVLEEYVHRAYAPADYRGGIYLLGGLLSVDLSGDMLRGILDAGLLGKM